MKPKPGLYPTWRALVRDLIVYLALATPPAVSALLLMTHPH